MSGFVSSWPSSPFSHYCPFCQLLGTSGRGMVQSLCSGQVRALCAQSRLEEGSPSSLCRCPCADFEPSVGHFASSSANHHLLVPPTGCVHRDALWCGQCAGWQIQYFQTGSFFGLQCSTSRRPRRQLLRQRQPSVSTMHAVRLQPLATPLVHSSSAGWPASTASPSHRAVPAIGRRNENRPTSWRSRSTGLITS